MFLVGMAILWSILPFRGGRWLIMVNVLLLFVWFAVALATSVSIGWEFIRSIFWDARADGFFAVYFVSDF
ncbi:hypothetical protein PCORN_07670 [Listeria cornellensis FSL F6-0969]|uniref:Uncharacterized protein n=1 Tax=Listeria cornellensis FSL F6-0969 TaxID=1265820 RepID=W7C5C5_9LIST|nr:hypothetical protein PCORN_07670 [Listeria cornellensis FSL F6-0969]